MQRYQSNLCFYLLIHRFIEIFKNFNDSNALFWSLKEIEYGNWNIGENNDGIITYDGQIPLTKVILLIKIIEFLHKENAKQWFD